MLLPVSGPICFVMFIILYHPLSKNRNERNHSRKLKHNVITAAGTTGIQELRTIEVVSSANKTTTSDTVENITYDVTVM